MYKCKIIGLFKKKIEVVKKRFKNQSCTVAVTLKELEVTSSNPANPALLIGLQLPPACSICLPRVAAYRTEGVRNVGPLQHSWIRHWLLFLVLHCKRVVGSRGRHKDEIWVQKPNRRDCCQFGPAIQHLGFCSPAGTVRLSPSAWTLRMTAHLPQWRLIPPPGPRGSYSWWNRAHTTEAETQINMSFSVEERGRPNTKEYRVFFSKHTILNQLFF